ncbi:glycine-rich domain-containing protein [Streptomyces sp. IBSBF 2435]|uniref:glycine-rich domain-containing protein n=1 Tax=Streptomyces sp. IBSBF 2435 TaxID=2903531 RepID=UPI002FDC431F
MQPTSPRALLAPGDFADVTATVLDNNPGMDTATAGRIVTEALAFVATAARHPGAPIAPSRTVDEGWHALLLHTAVYARLCDRLGVFVHHYPERPDTARQGADVLARTMVLIRSDGHTPDPELWTTPVDNRIPVAAPCGHAPRCGPIDPIPAPPSDVAALVG